MQELNSPESWEEAKRLAALIGPVPSSFSTCIRFLKSDGAKGNKELSPATKYCVHRLLKSANFSARMYYCALTFFPEKLSALSEFSSKSILEIFSPKDLAHIVSLVYLYRCIKRGCTPEQWEAIVPVLLASSEIGGHLGVAIPNIGFARSLFVSSIRQLSSALFLGVDQDKYVKYRRVLKDRKSLFDLEEETTLWGCNHIQTASILLQALGLGVGFAADLAAALTVRDTPRDQWSIDMLAGHTAAAWIDALHQTGAPPNITHDGRFYPTSVLLKTLLERVAEIRKDGSKYIWLEKGSLEISPESTPLLYAPGSSQALEVPIEAPDPELQKLSVEDFAEN